MREQGALRARTLTQPLSRGRGGITRPASGRVQPGGEIRSNKSKLMKGNESKNPFISFYFFFRIWTFQWVTGDSNKKISSSPNSRSRLWSEIPQTHSGAPFPSPPEPQRRPSWAAQKIYSTDCRFGKCFADFSVFRNPVHGCYPASCGCGARRRQSPALRWLTMYANPTLRLLP
jgi:hypothetical protein